jgi:hypothetical protein
MSAIQSQTATTQEKRIATLQNAEATTQKKRIATHQDVVVTKKTIATSQEEAVLEKSMVDQKNATIQSARDPQVVTETIEDIKEVPGNPPLPTVFQLTILLET